MMDKHVSIPFVSFDVILFILHVKFLYNNTPSVIGYKFHHYKLFSLNF